MDIRSNQNTVSDFGTIRLELVRLCASGSHVEALLALEETGLGVEEAPGLWEYLERQMSNAGQDKLAEAVRERLAQAGAYTAQMAVADAQIALERGETHRAELILKSTFGLGDLPPTVAKIMGRAMSQNANPQALRYLAQLGAADAEAALAEIDLLRADDLLLAAEERCRHYMMVHRNDTRFQVRLARTTGALNKWDEALSHWEELSNSAEFPRGIAIANRIRLLVRLERFDETYRLMAEFLLEPSSLSESISVSYALGLTDLVNQFLAKAVERHAVRPVAQSEWDVTCQFLLENGQLGTVAWLKNLGLPVGHIATEALKAAQRVVGPAIDDVYSRSQGARLTSPGCLLPFPPYFRLRQPPLAPNLQDAKILLVNASLVSGGAERQFVILVKALLAKGIRPDQLDVALFSLAPDRGRAHFLADLEQTGVRIRDLQSESGHYRRIDPDLEDRCQLLPKPLRGDVVALHHVISEVRPDILHGWQDRAALACGYVGTYLGVEKIIMSARNMQPKKRERGAQLDTRTLFSALCELPNVSLTANSVAGARDYEDWLQLPVNEVGVLHNGLDLERFSAGPRALDQLGHQPRRVVNIAGVFRLSPNKRPILWLETIAELKRISDYDIRPRIVGTGPLSTEIAARARSLGLDDLLLAEGLVTPQDIYHETDLVLLMSRVEGTPNVLLEAQAMGIAVAGCDVGGVRGAVLVHGPDAGLVLPEDITPAEAARSLADWLPAALRASGQGRQDFVRENYSLDALGERALEFYGSRQRGTDQA